MSSEVMKILEMMDSGKMNTDKALELISNLDSSRSLPSKKASKIKISIVSKSDNKTINIPAIPFWLITSLGSLGLSISSWVMKHSKDLDDESKKYIGILEEIDLKEMIEVLRDCGPFDMVDIEDGDVGDMVKISVL